MANGQGYVGDKHGCERHDHAHWCFKCISWSAIVIGALVGIGLSFLLNLFSVAIGLSVFAVSNDGIVSVAVGGFLGLIIGAIVAMFVSGFTAGYLGRPYCRNRNLGILYGFATWSLALIVTVLLTSHVGRYVAAYSNFIANPATIIVTTNENAPMVSENPATGTVAVNAEKATNTLSLGALIVFVLFFIGAVSTCVGAYWAMTCCDGDDDRPRIA